MWSSLLVEIISSTLDYKKPINDIDNMDTVTDWDSLNHIKIILNIEKHTGYKFSPIEISQARSVSNIQEIINSDIN